MLVLKVCEGRSVLKVLVSVTECPAESTPVAVTVRVRNNGSVQSLCQAVFELFMVPLTARTPVSSPVTSTLWSVPLVAVTVMPLRGSAPALPFAGVIVRPTVSGDGVFLACGPPPVLPLEEDWHAAGTMPTAQIAAIGVRRRRIDR